VEYSEECTYPNSPCGKFCLVRTWKWCSKAGEVYRIQLVDDGIGSYLVGAMSAEEPCANAGDCLYDPPPANDDCDDAIPISGEGSFEFENTYATPENEYQMCHYTGTYPPTHDVWYCWTSPCDGPVTVETCGLTTVDTQLAVFSGCDCAVTNDIICNNDECGYQSHLEFEAVAGQTYRIQVGTRIDLGGGNGQFRISCGAELQSGGPCGSANLGLCVNPSHDNAVNSTRGEYVFADNFTMKTVDPVYRVCWWGAYFDGKGSCTRDSPDDFTITYYSDFCGKPWGIVGGPFSESAGTLITSTPGAFGPGRTAQLIGGLVSEIQYLAYHDPVPLESGSSYWIEITNAPSGECSWYWETLLSNDPFSYQSSGSTFISSNAQSIAADAAFEICQCGWDCMDRAFAPTCHSPPGNDLCEQAHNLEMGEVAAFKTTGAGTDGVPVDPQSVSPDLINYFPLGDRQVHKDIWYSLEALCPGTIAVDVCNADFDVKTALYIEPWCDANLVIEVDDDSCGPDLGIQSRLLTFLDGLYQVFLLRLGGYRGDFGSGEVTWSYIAPEASDLRVFAAFANCRSASCPGPSCNPLYGFCCDPQDFDADGDVDLLDYTYIYQTLVGP